MNDKPSKMSASFAWLNATQFLGALNDNVFKLLGIFCLIKALGEGHASTIVATGGLIFALPFLLFTPAAGVLADRLSKRDIIVFTKCLEVAVMILGALVFFSGRYLLAYGIIFLMSFHSALFGPSKYGIIPELVRREDLSRANSYLVALTFLAVILGTALAPFLTEQTGGRFGLAALACVGIAVAGLLASLRIERTPAVRSGAKASFFVLKDVWTTLQSVRGDRDLMLTVFAAAYFNLVGAFMQLNLIPYGMQHLGLTETHSGYLFLCAAVGIGVGSIVAGRVSGRHVEFGIVPLGALGLAVCNAALLVFSPGVAGAAVIVFFAGASAGIYIVPLESFIQLRAPPERRGEIIAANGFLSWIGVLLAAALIFLLNAVLGLTPAQSFLVVGAFTVVLTVVAIRILPDFLVRFITLLLTRIFYRIRVVGLENLPTEGGALLVSNHVSLADALHILATQQRRIRFMMHRHIYERHKLRALFRLMGVIPIAMEDSPKRIVEALRAARQALDDGFLVCIFAEGALTRTGMIEGFKHGLERIVRDSSHPVIPVYIGGTWGSILSHYHTRKMLHRPLKIPYPVSIHFGKPLPSTAKAWQVRQAVTELSCDYFESRKSHHRSVALEFVRIARKNGAHHAMSDTSGRRLTFRAALAASLALADALRPRTREGKAIGLLVPTSVGGVLANLALAFLGRPAVNLNFTVSREAFDSALRQAEIRTIVASRAFIEKMPRFAELPGLLYLEDLVASIGQASRLRSLLRAVWMPARLLTKIWTRSPDDVLTIIFSSGTTGEPKGVVLSQHNILSDIASLAQVFRPERTDNICAPLPLFHSFGYTGGIWFPMLTGMSASYHVSPLDAARVAEIIRENRCTLLFATPTFLSAYARKAEPADFASLRYAIAGGEKMKGSLADAFEAKFGVRPLEGYGATELSPVAALSVPGRSAEGEKPRSAREGSVGQPIPGVAVRIVDPDTGVARPPGEPGLMLIRGPNLMLGYLQRDDLTAEAVRDGWYRTGDIAHVDEDGYIFIRDRIARFSKIGGEMIPHMAVEDEYHKALKSAEPVVAVTSVQDERKGEKLVVLFTPSAGDASALHAAMEGSALPNLWKPSKDAYFKVDALPLTGTGKLDVLGLRKMAAALQSRSGPQGTAGPTSS
jgi:acyl-[acyl-carrier-protein]-phospholipid O-acyltransferase / long-chain-fatty-acid--[acyl-carrier-protein] ligase